MVLGYRVDSEPLELHFDAPLREPHIRPRMLDHVSHLVWLVAAPCVVMVSGPHDHYVSTIDLDVPFLRSLLERLRGVDVVIADVAPDIENHPVTHKVVLKGEEIGRASCRERVEGEGGDN